MHFLEWWTKHIQSYKGPVKSEQKKQTTHNIDNPG